MILKKKIRYFYFFCFLLFVSSGFIFSKSDLVGDIKNINLNSDKRFSLVLKKVIPSIVLIKNLNSIDIKVGDNTFKLSNLWDCFRFSKIYKVKNFLNKCNVLSHSVSSGLGTGVIIDSKNGYIITNNHIIKDSRNISVTLSDGRSFKALVLGKDSNVDIALLKISNFGKITQVNIGNSDLINIGDKVYVVGYPFGIGPSVTSGIISGTDRVGFNINQYEDYIQVDATFNRGNSGGALLDKNGNLIGINTSVVGSNLGVGINFSIPINMVLPLINQIVDLGEVKHVSLGALGISLDDTLSKVMNININFGIFLTDIIPNSVAYKAGLKLGDVIVTLNDKNITSIFSLNGKLARYTIGNYIKLGILRNNVLIYKKVYLSTFYKDNLSYDLGSKFDGSGLTTYNPFNFLRDNSYGVYVGDVKLDSISYFYGLRKGDIILSINDNLIKNLGSLRLFLGTKYHDVMFIKVLRNNNLSYLVIT